MKKGDVKVSGATTSTASCLLDGVALLAPQAPELGVTLDRVTTDTVVPSPMYTESPSPMLDGDVLGIRVAAGVAASLTYMVPVQSLLV